MPPAKSKTRKTTNWTILKQLINTSLPGNPNINFIKYIDESIEKVTGAIVTAINLSSKSKLINGNNRKLLIRITRKSPFEIISGKEGKKPKTQGTEEPQTS
ncbi:hypothetical protein AVEN_196507-1 [Araneus ventricosus]|uniref:Uncharacterized protein n=1 Tax=Araneus ventricosus TaxID=182803 RepID=A0A4Y2URW9_ARAVE|nr:hypothetical protein AVEN_196507-1 [Araneus ventricosus]